MMIKISLADPGDCQWKDLDDIMDLETASFFAPIFELQESLCTKTSARACAIGNLS